MNRLAVTTAVAMVAFGAPMANAQSHAPLGCYSADRPLGTSASAEGVPGPIGAQIGESGEGLRILRTFMLLDSGHVDRPRTAMRDWWKSGSRWTMSHDTLTVVLSTRTSGWRLTLVPVTANSDSLFAGEAQYLSDAIVVGQPPLRVPVRAERTPC